MPAYKTPAPAIKTMTVLICTHNRANLLISALTHLNAARAPENYKVNVMVMLNACSDNSNERLKEFIAGAPGCLHIEWHEEPKPGKSFALNSAIKKITSELVAFVDDDQRVDRNYLVNICRIAQHHPDAGIICGRILPDWDGSEPSWVHDTGPYRIYPPPIPRQDWGDTSRPLRPGDGLPGGGNIIVRRELFKRIDGFSTNLGPQGHNLKGGEDTEFIIRALKEGVKLIYTPDVIQYHHVNLERLRLGYLLKRSFSRSRTITKMKNPEPKLPPMYMLKKFSGYGFQSLFSADLIKTRFYLVRTAAVFGEILGTLSFTRK